MTRAHLARPYRAHRSAPPIPTSRMHRPMLTSSCGASRSLPHPARVCASVYGPAPSARHGPRPTRRTPRLLATPLVQTGRREAYAQHRFKTRTRCGPPSLLKLTPAFLSATPSLLTRCMIVQSRTSRPRALLVPQQLQHRAPDTDMPIAPTTGPARASRLGVLPFKPSTIYTHADPPVGPRCVNQASRQRSATVLLMLSAQSLRSSSPCSAC